MSHELLVSSRDHANIAAAYHWYEKRVPGLGADFARRVDATLSHPRIASTLSRPPRQDALGDDPSLPYAIYFVWDEPARFISISRVLHFSQDVSAHLDSP